MKLIEWSRIDELTQGDDEFGQELLVMFLEDAQETVEKIKVAQNSGDLEVVGAQAHILKGSSGNVGASLIFDLSKDLENHARHEGGNQVAVFLTKIMEGLEQTAEEIKKRYG